MVLWASGWSHLSPQAFCPWLFPQVQSFSIGLQARHGRAVLRSNVALPNQPTHPQDGTICPFMGPSSVMDTSRWICEWTSPEMAYPSWESAACRLSSIPCGAKNREQLEVVSSEGNALQAFRKCVDVSWVIWLVSSWWLPIFETCPISSMTGSTINRGAHDEVLSRSKFPKSWLSASGSCNQQWLSAACAVSLFSSSYIKHPRINSFPWSDTLSNGERGSNIKLRYSSIRSWLVKARLWAFGISWIPHISCRASIPTAQMSTEGPWPCSGMWDSLRDILVKLGLR